MQNPSRYFAPTSAHRSLPVPLEGRREHPRFALRLAITLVGENNFYTGLSENISEAGIFIATQTMLPIGTPVVMTFTLPFSDEPISVSGRVQWVRGPDAMATLGNNFGSALTDVKPGIGVRFEAMGTDAVAAIRSFMNVRPPEFFA